MFRLWMFNARYACFRNDEMFYIVRKVKTVSVYNDAFFRCVQIACQRNKHKLKFRIACHVRCVCLNCMPGRRAFGWIFKNCNVFGLFLAYF